MKVGIIVAAVFATCALLVGSAGAMRADNPVLTGDVGAGDSFTITLKDASGQSVKHLDPGTYTLVVHDHSSLHNFDFSGPGAAATTDVEFIGDKTFTVTLGDGTYFFQCDPHSAQMRGSFTVGAVTTTTTPTPPAPPPAPAATKASASIAGSASTFKPSSGLSAGAFVIAVNDRSASDGFRLSGPGVSKATGAAFRGKVTWTVKLKAGRYSFGSALHPKLRHSFTVTA
jgi:plastocyanin